MAFPACAGLGLYWFMWQPCVILSTWKGFALLYLPGWSGQRSGNTEIPVSGPHSQTVFLPLCANNVDILDLTRIRRGFSVSIVVCFSSAEVSAWVCVCVFVCLQCCLRHHTVAELVPGMYKRIIVFRIGGSAHEVSTGPKTFEIQRLLTLQCVLVAKSAFYLLDLCTLMWPFS